MTENDTEAEAEQDRDDDEGSSDTDLSEEDKEQRLAEREERLDPDNRPDNVEVDNTDRDFDIARGQFEDSEDDPDLGPFNDPTSPDGEIEA